MLAQHHESLREETVWRREVLPNLCQESMKHQATKSYKRILFVVELVNLWKSHICVPNPNNKRLNMVPHLVRHPDFFPYSALRHCKPVHVFYVLIFYVQVHWVYMSWNVLFKKMPLPYSKYTGHYTASMFLLLVKLHASKLGKPESDIRLLKHCLESLRCVMCLFFFWVIVSVQSLFQ